MFPKIILILRNSFLFWSFNHSLSCPKEKTF